MINRYFDIRKAHICILLLLGFSVIIVCCRCSQESVVDGQAVENEKNSIVGTNSEKLPPSRQKVQEILANAKPNTRYSPYQKSVRTNFDPIPKEIEEKLIQQGEVMFSSVQDYDYESLDYYAPTLTEMKAFYKVFDPVAFQQKFNYFEKNYKEDGKTFGVNGLKFGDNIEYDQDLLRRITARGALLRAKSLSLTKERVKIDESVELNEIYIKPSPLGNDRYDIHIRFKKRGIEEYYEMVNEACWLTDRTCLYTNSWNFLGKYIPLTGEYHDSKYNVKDAGPIDFEAAIQKQELERYNQLNNK